MTPRRRAPRPRGSPRSAAPALVPGGRAARPAPRGPPASGAAHQRPGRPGPAREAAPPAAPHRARPDRTGWPAPETWPGPGRPDAGPPAHPAPRCPRSSAPSRPCSSRGVARPPSPGRPRHRRGRSPPPGGPAAGPAPSPPASPRQARRIGQRGPPAPRRVVVQASQVIVEVGEDRSGPDSPTGADRTRHVRAAARPVRDLVLVRRRHRPTDHHHQAGRPSKLLLRQPLLHQLKHLSGQRTSRVPRHGPGASRSPAPPLAAGTTPPAVTTEASQPWVPDRTCCRRQPAVIITGYRPPASTRPCKHIRSGRDRTRPGRTTLRWR